MVRVRNRFFRCEIQGIGCYERPFARGEKRRVVRDNVNSFKVCANLKLALWKVSYLKNKSFYMMQEGESVTGLTNLFYVHPRPVIFPLTRLALIFEINVEWKQISILTLQIRNGNFECDTCSSTFHPKMSFQPIGGFLLLRIITISDLPSLKSSLDTLILAMRMANI
jgi:hypothetical protein